MERKGRKKSKQQNREGDTEMSAGTCGRGWEIKAKQDLRVKLGNECILDVWKFKQKLPENEEVQKNKKDKKEVVVV